MSQLNYTCPHGLAASLLSFDLNMMDCMCRIMCVNCHGVLSPFLDLMSPANTASGFSKARSLPLCRHALYFITLPYHVCHAFQHLGLWRCCPMLSQLSNGFKSINVNQNEAFKSFWKTEKPFCSKTLQSVMAKEPESGRETVIASFILSFKGSVVYNQSQVHLTALISIL